MLQSEDLWKSLPILPSSRDQTSNKLLPFTGIGRQNVIPQCPSPWGRWQHCCVLLTRSKLLTITSFKEKNTSWCPDKQKWLWFYNAAQKLLKEYTSSLPPFPKELFMHLRAHVWCFSPRFPKAHKQCAMEWKESSSLMFKVGLFEFSFSKGKYRKPVSHVTWVKEQRRN